MYTFLLFVLALLVSLYYFQYFSDAAAKGTASRSHAYGAGLKSRVWGFGFRVRGFGFRVWGSGFTDQDQKIKVQSFGFEVLGSGFKVYCSGFKI